MSIPNLISLFRFFSGFFVVYFIFIDAFAYAFALFCVAAVSDFVDGFLARYLKSHSKLGAYLDPLADKFLLSSTFIALSICGKIPFLFTLFVVLRDILILVGVASLWFAQKQLRIVPLLMSKINTLVQMIFVLVSLYPHFSDAQGILIDLLGLVVLLTTVLSAGQYTYIWSKLMFEKPVRSKRKSKMGTTSL